MLPLTAALSVGSFLYNFSQNQDSLRQQTRAYQAYLNEIKGDQSRWDERFGKIETMLTKFMSGTETAGEKFRREMSERKIGQSGFDQAAAGIAADFEAAKSSAEASIAGAGLNSSGAVATTQARLGEAAINAGQQARTAALEFGRSSMFDLLARGGPRPSLAPALAANPALTGANRMELDAFPLLSGVDGLMGGDGANLFDYFSKKKRNAVVDYSTGGNLG